MRRITGRTLAATAALLPAMAALACTERDARAQQSPPAQQVQQQGFALNHFAPSERGSDWFVLESLDIRGHLRPAVGVVAEWANRPLVVRNGSGTVTGSIVANQAFLHPGATLVLWDRLRFGIDVPVQIYADGDGVTKGSTFYAPPSSSTSLGDIRVGLDARLFGRYGDDVIAALGVQLSLPTGSEAAYTGDGTTRVTFRGLIAGDVAPFAYAVKFGGTIRPHDLDFGGSTVGSELFAGASFGLRVLSKRFVVGPEVFGHTVTSALLHKRSSPAEGLLGFHYTAGDYVRVGAGVGTGFGEGFGTPRIRGMLSFEVFQPAVPDDRDHDGVYDRDDACPNVFGVHTEDPKTNGCPKPPPPDRDHDGILDADDACPDVPGVRTNDPKTNGCPKPSDRDGDTIVDTDDACPEVPGVRTDDPTTNGCPAPTDRDKDGVLDKEDACPDVQGVRTSDPTTNGCPDPDRDKDGVLNDVDACPDEPGKADADPKRNGCPKAFIQNGQIRILDQVKFKFGSAEILPGKDSQEVLDAVNQVLRDHWEIKTVRVEGHTDSVGSAAYNKKLSANRAASVVKWLVAHGVPKERLTSEGFGAERPLAPNETEAGRKENRRVEFHIGDATSSDGGDAEPPKTP